MKTVTVRIIALSLIVSVITVGLLVKSYWLTPEQHRIIVINKCNYDVAEFWETAYEGLVDAADELEVDIVYMNGAYEHEIEEQKAVIESAINLEPDAIVLVASDYYEIGPYAQKILDKGIKLIVMDSGVDINSEEVPFVGTNNIKAGERLGSIARIVQEDNDQGIILEHYAGVQTADERVAGIKKGYGEDRIISTFSCDSDETIAYEITMKFLQENKDVSVIFATNETVTVGSAKAVKELELEDEVNIYGFDGSKKHIQYLEQGIVDYTIIQTPYQMGYFAIVNAVALVEGDDVPSFIETDFLPISIDNMYKVGNREILFPFVNKN